MTHLGTRPAVRCSSSAVRTHSPRIKNKFKQYAYCSAQVSTTQASAGHSQKGLAPGSRVRFFARHIGTLQPLSVNRMLAYRTGNACPAAQPKVSALAICTRCTRCRRPLPRSARWCVRASKDGGDDDRGVNWDAAWSEFKSTAKKGALRHLCAYPPLVGVTAGRGCAGDAGIPETESRKAPSFSRRPRRTPLQEQIRKQEDFVLDFWSSETVFKARLAVVLHYVLEDQSDWHSLIRVHRMRRWAACL